MLLTDLRHAFRGFRRAPGFTAIAVLILALGIGVNTSMFSLVNTLVLQPRPGRIEQLVGLFSRDRAKPDRYRDFSYPTYLDLRDSSGVFETVMAQTFGLVGITDHDVTKQSFAALVSANYFSTLGVSLAAGRPFSADEERPGSNARIAIASYVAWQRSGRNPSFVGSTVRINGSDFTIVGIAPRGFTGTMSLFSPQWWFPLGSYDILVNEAFKSRDTGLSDRRNHDLNLVGALRPGVSRAAGEQALDVFSRQLAAAYPDTDRDQAFILAGLPRLSISSSPESSGVGAMFSALLMLMSLLVLLVACLNLANLLLARGAARRREIAIRQALGSGRRRIIQQLFVEGLVLSSCAAVAGVVIGWWTSVAMSAWIAGALPLGLQVVLEPPASLVPVAALLALVSTVCFALGPAWTLSRQAVASDLKGELAPTTRAARRLGVGPLLVVGQLALSLALVASGGLFVRAAMNAARMDPGFAMDRHLVVSMDPSMAGADAVRTREFYRDALARIRSVPGVEHASVGAIVPFGEIEEGRSLRLNPGDEPVNAEFNLVGADYFATLGMRVLRGREFTAADEEPGPGVKAAVLDRLLAKRLFGDADPIGRQVLVQKQDLDPERFVVAGIVSEMKQDALDVTPRRHIFLPTGAMFRPSLTMHVRTSPGVPDGDALGTIVRELRAIDPRIPILSARTMAEQRYRSLVEWAMRASAAIFSAFGLLALGLATIGIYGVLAYEVSRRTREIGIRIALGATGRDVLRLVLGEGARTTTIALVLGVLLAAGLGKLASGLLYQVSPFDPVVLTTAAAVLSAAAMLASFVPARRATRLAPMDALRTE
jgi:predicted permease